MPIKYITIDVENAELAGRSAGKYLEEIGKTDLATLTRDEWINFLRVVIGTYEDLEIPF